MIRFALVLLVASGCAFAGQSAPMLVEDGRVVWNEDDSRFGGLSGLEIRDNGSSLVAVSDRGAWVTADLIREDGRLTDVTMTGIGLLKGVDGEPLDNARIRDAEGLALDAQGRAYVSFETRHRVRRYDRIDGPAAEIPGHPDFPNLITNSSLEALAVGDDGTIYTMPERSGAWERPFPIYRYRDGIWDTDLEVRRDGRFLVVGADFGPDGRLYVLERDFRNPFGFQTRLRSFRLGADALEDETLLLHTTLWQLDNMEGISAWQDAAGDTRITLVSDDNFSFPQRTMLVEYVLKTP
jgi:hypothetical protein